MRYDVEELYDYDVLRKITEPTMFVVRLSEPTLVLGRSQPLSVFDQEKILDALYRRRRGGGGIVLLQPDDIWIDWWIPSADERWHPDVHQSSMMVGRWWQEALSDQVKDDFTVHDGSLEGDPSIRVACFAGRGPGEVFLEGKKVVGVTQWRVREGIFLSTVAHAASSQPIIDVLATPPPGLDLALDHHTLKSAGISDSEAIVDFLRANTGVWRFRQLYLNA